MEKIFEISYEKMSQTKKIYLKNVPEIVLFEIAEDVLEKNVQNTSKSELIEEDCKTTIYSFSNYSRGLQLKIRVSEIAVYDSFQEYLGR
ncbi:hypothetical protein QNH26_20565 [Peribacillus frigoritolerans]|uniref:hypothetical protein n=1 Tax=Peribacillus frigoritolerans TaxID=450367 RepID=UPI0024C189E8|nr:hypothetical protein [Peribacillus frigoritolerans]WHX66037.1 hypothetical protein QNH26_20565 [Peribacillus frigoritolerans]